MLEFIHIMLGFIYYMYVTNSSVSEKLAANVEINVLAVVSNFDLH